MKDSQETISLAGEAYVILRERILRRELPIGKVISRRKIATALGMSMLPVVGGVTTVGTRRFALKVGRGREPESRFRRSSSGAVTT